MKIGDEVYIHGYVDEIRQNVVIIRNDGGYFGTVAEEITNKSENPNTCGDAISRKHLLEEIAMLKKSPWFNENTYGSKVIRKEAVEIVEDVCIKREPSVTPQQRTGRWIQKEEEGDAEPFIIWECSECHCVDEDGKPSYKYCPQCGARMEVEE